MRVGVTKETEAGERRVAVVPETVKKLAAQSLVVSVERGAGLGAGFRDEEYTAAGATIAERAEVLAADIVLCVKRPAPDVVTSLKRGAALVTLLYPLGSADVVRAAAEQRVITIALDMIPRTTLAQSMDVLSSQANLAGYWAVVAAAARLPKIFPLLMTAAGTITPARVLVIGAGVAGLQAIGTAKRLG
ncbi:MAG TPA: NAD(P)(+) transhydrogenase (Re/Si-specific) subunit alpha, partial [Myxococcota bacterium]|nr:NAD(P)(+) transhydrogenase (Re/Si-specific) subunit alpha [Myxococcota bacterium]